MRTILVLLAALSTLSCSTVNWIGQQVSGGGGVTQDELRSGLLDFSSSFTVLVTEAADRIITSLERTIEQKAVTYDFHRLMEGATKVKTSEFADRMIANL